MACHANSALTRHGNGPPAAVRDVKKARKFIVERNEENTIKYRATHRVVFM